MHGTIKARPLRPWMENTLVCIASISAGVMAILIDMSGMPHRWHTAIFGTVVPFSTVILLRRMSWPRLTFWISLWILLSIHLLLAFIVFGIILRHVSVIGLLWWLPIAFIEMLALLELQRRLEGWIKAKKELASTEHR
jgi:hypothetical protein